MFDTIVVGGGISGLTAAYKLKQRNRKVLLLETKPYIGGNIRTLEIDDYRVETGPHSFMGSAEYIWKLIKELNLSNQVEKANTTSKNRYIYRNNKLNPLPTGPYTFLSTSLLSTKAKCRLMAEPFIRGGALETETAWEFFVRRFGTEAATYIMAPFISGVYAGDSKQLGAKAAFPKFWNFEKETGSMIRGAIQYMRKKRKRLEAEGKTPNKGMYTIKGGLGNLTLAIAKNLNDSIRINSSVIRLQSHNGSYKVYTDNKEYESASVILAAPPQQTAKIIANIHPEIEMKLQSIPMAPVALIQWALPSKSNTYEDGFGFLMPKVYDFRVLGTIFASDIYNNRSPEGMDLYASFYGGMLDPSFMDLSDDQMVETLIKEHSQLFNNNLSSNARIIKIIRYPNAIPQMMPNHLSIMTEVDKALQKTKGISLAGNYVIGVSIENAIISGYEAAANMNEYLRTIG